MVVRPDPDAERYGLVELDADDRVRRVAGQPPGPPGPLRPFMFPGLQVFESTIIRLDGCGAAFSVTRVTYPRLLKAGAPVQGFVTSARWVNVDTPGGARGGERRATPATVRF